VRRLAGFFLSQLIARRGRQPGRKAGQEARATNDGALPPSASSFTRGCSSPVWKRGAVSRQHKNMAKNWGESDGTGGRGPPPDLRVGDHAVPRSCCICRFFAARAANATRKQNTARRVTTFASRFFLLLLRRTTAETLKWLTPKVVCGRRRWGRPFGQRGYGTRLVFAPGPCYKRNYGGRGSSDAGAVARFAERKALRRNGFPLGPAQVFPHQVFGPGGPARFNRPLECGGKPMAKAGSQMSSGHGRESAGVGRCLNAGGGMKPGRTLPCGVTSGPLGDSWRHCAKKLWRSDSKRCAPIRAFCATSTRMVSGTITHSAPPTAAPCVVTRRASARSAASPAHGPSAPPAPLHSTWSDRLHRLVGGDVGSEVGFGDIVSPKTALLQPRSRRVGRMFFPRFRVPLLGISRFDADAERGCPLSAPPQAC